MRVRRPGLEGERGATLLIVALALVALLGFVSLVVDVGGLLVKRRQLVNAADAAALAAAQSCGRKEGQLQATYQASLLSQMNDSDAAVVEGYPVFEPSCEAAAGRATVRVHADQETFFSPVMGFGDSEPVVAEAVAVWGGPGGGDFVPFMLSEGTLLDCGIGVEELIGAGEATSPIECRFWMNNKIEEMGNSQWAMLNLNTADSSRWGWNVSADHGGCVPANTNETLDWIAHGALGLTLNYEAPTYVCIDSGASPPTFRALADLRGQIRFFPVNDPGIPGALPSRGYTDDRLGLSIPYPHGQVNRNGEPCPSPCTPGNGGPGENGPVDKYDIVGFARLEIVSVLQGGKNVNDLGDEQCGWPPDSNGWCLTVLWHGYYTDVYSSEVGEGDNFGVVVVRLIR